MIRRAQTARHRASQSVAVADDLGFVRESDESNIEEQLRSDLATAKQEIGKLKGQIDSLNKALKDRPPSEEVQVLRKELQDLELLLHGTQKENEKALSELVRVREREKLMERELRRLIGEDWEDTLAVGGRYSPSRPVNATSSVPRHAAISDNSTFISSGVGSAERKDTAVLAYVDQIRTMLTGMDERLQFGEKNVQAAIERAEAEQQQLRDMLNQEESDPVPS